MTDNITKLHKNICSQLITNDGYRITAHPLFGMNPNGTPKRGKEHIIIWRLANQGIQIPKGCCIHHVDGNKLNNNIKNLVLMSFKAHTQLHNELKASKADKK